MIKSILSNVLVSFIFGWIIALIAYFGNFPLPNQVILIIPFFIALINLLGSLAAMLVVILLSTRHLMNEKNLQITGFITAATVNTLITFSVILYYDDLLFHPEFIFLYFTGMAMGAVYGVYRYRIELVNERIRFLEEIAEKNRQLQESSRQLAITMERNRMSRELHDSISQGLHGLTFSIYSLRNKLGNESDDVKKTLDHMEASAKSTLDELRAMIEQMKPSILAEKGLEAALATIADLFSQRQNIPVQVYLQVPEHVTPKTELALYRITQEALANIEKHADAKKVILDLHYKREQMILNIKDNGKGFNTSSMSPGHGLRNMRLRTEEAGGSFEIVSNANLGTSIIVKLPV